MPNASTLDPEKRFMALFVGPKHSGKTCAACSFMSADITKKVKVHDGDGRIRGILGAPWIDKTRVDYEYFPPRQPGKPPYYQRLNDDLEAMIAMCNVGQNPYETLIEDSLTALTANFIQDAIPLTHAGTKGKRIGMLNVAGPEDYGFEATATYSVMSCLRSLPIPNIIVTAHVVDRFGREDPENPFSESVVVGEKLSVRDKIGVNIGIYFDHIFRFDRKVLQGQERFFVEFIGNLACTSFTGLTPGQHEITGLNFKDYLMKLVSQTKGEVK